MTDRRQHFVERAQLKHGTKYDYSKVRYTNSKTKVTIICPEHGPFRQRPTNHMCGGRGCPKCNVMGTAEFIRRAQLKHGTKYDYSQVKYVTSSTKITIVCRKHGPFRQRPSCHISYGHGCPHCGQESSFLTNEEFIRRAQLKHGTKYDYSRVVCVRKRSYVEIVCPEHGSFRQSPEAHIQGKGCLKCGLASTRAKLTHTTAEFIRRARLVHGDRYDYPNIRYVHSCKPVEIVCREHGAFRMLPKSHTQGHGCPQCHPFGAVSSETWARMCRAYEHGLTCEEIARALGVTVSAVSHAFCNRDDSPKRRVSGPTLLHPKRGCITPMVRQLARQGYCSRAIERILLDNGVMASPNTVATERQKSRRLLSEPPPPCPCVRCEILRVRALPGELRKRRSG